MRPVAVECREPCQNRPFEVLQRQLMDDWQDHIPPAYRLAVSQAQPPRAKAREYRALGTTNFFALIWI